MFALVLAAALAFDDGGNDCVNWRRPRSSHFKTDDADSDHGRAHCNDYRCDGTCTDATDCSLGGLCAKGKCVCDATFMGPNCVALNLDLATRGPAWSPAPGEKRNGSWGGNVVLGAGNKFHLFYAEFVGHCGLGSWGTNSEVGHALASSPQGPYVKQEAVLPVFHHNPTAVYDNSSKTFLHAVLDRQPQFHAAAKL